MISVVIDEGTIHRMAGNQSVMREQALHMVTLAAQPNISLQVIPLKAGIHSSGGFSFTILSFSDPADPRVVYAELLTTDHNIERPAEVGQYQAAFDQLRGLALEPGESTALITDRYI